MADFFDELEKTLGNVHARAASKGVVGDSTEYIDTGVYWLNAVLSGSIYHGFPDNKIMVLQGEPSTGKSFFTLAIAANYLKANPKARLIFMETEGAITKDLLESRGLDVSRVFVAPVSTVQEMKTTAIRALDAYQKLEEKHGMMFLLDSLGMLSTDKEVKDAIDASDKRDMTRAQLLRSTFRVIGLKLAQLNVPMVCTNHTYAVVGAYVPTSIGSGGSGDKYAASVILNLTKSQDKEGTDRVGNIIKARVVKSRFTREGAVAQCKLSYSKGLDKWFGMTDFAIESGIWKKSGTRVELPDGSKLFAKVIYADPEKYFTKDVLDAIDKHVGSLYNFGGDDVPDFDTDEEKNDE